MILAFEHDTADNFDFTTHSKHDSDSVYLTKAAQIIRKHEMFSTEQKFDGSVTTSSCQRNLEGPAITRQCEQKSHIMNAVLTQGQVMIFNSSKDTCVVGKEGRHVF